MQLLGEASDRARARREGRAMANNKEAAMLNRMDPEEELAAGEVAGSRAARTAHQFPTNKVSGALAVRVEADEADVGVVDEETLRAEDLASTDRRRVR
jgi:hypothetical protein